MESEDKENVENIFPARAPVIANTKLPEPERLEEPREFGESKRDKELDYQPEPEPLTTKVYYFVDDQEMPYSTEVPVPPSRITLADFKHFITRRNYKYYSKVMDAALNAEVKAELRDDYETLKPNLNGRFELFLLSEITPPLQQTHQSHTAPLAPLGQQLQLQTRGARASLMGKRASAHCFYDPKLSYFDDSSIPNDNRLFGDSRFASSLSDGDSQYTTTDFTSVSQQNGGAPVLGRHGFASNNPLGHIPCKGGGADPRLMTGAGPPNNNKRYDSNNKPCWTREKRRRYRRPPSPSFLSSTFEDTEVSMALDLITVTFNMNTRQPFGMSVVVKNTRSFSGILVHSVAPNSLVALDGRIKPGFILLEVNDIPLDEFDSSEAINVLTSAVRQATETKGQLKLSCARGDVPKPAHTIFRPPTAEPVRPIDPTAWVQHTNTARGLLPEEGVRMGPAGSFPADVTNKCSTLPRASMQTKCNRPESPVHTKPPPYVTLPGGLRYMQNPSTEVTNTSGHASMDCSIAEEEEAPDRRTKGQRKAGSGGGKGGIAAAIRSLLCLNKRCPRRKGQGGGSKKK